ncbi:MAG: ATP-binding protein, partial [Candidatus Eremiobacterota bacterium]
LTGEPLLLVGKVDNSEFNNIVVRHEDIKSSLCVPLKVKEQLRGVLNLRKASQAHDFTEEQLKFLSMIGDQAAIAIENARLYDLEKKRSEELEQLNRKITFEKIKTEAVLKSLSDGVIVLNDINEIVLINSAMEKLFSVNSSYLESKNYRELIRAPEFVSLVEGMSEKPDAITFIELSVGKDGRIFDVHCAFIRDSSGEILGKVIVFHDITHMKKIQQMKSDFVSMVSHELRTPLTSIMGFVDILINKELDKNRRKKYLSIIQEESSRLLELINNLLDLSRLEAGRYEFKKERINLVDIINKSIVVISPQSVHKIIFNSTVSSCIFIGDEDMLYRVMINLLSNAIKYSPDGGDISVTLTDKKDMWEISVADNGIGISREVIPRLFERFYRGASAISTKIKGTGLGLANVKYILEVHGGSITVESELDKGSRFIFYLPKEGKFNEN